MAEDHDLLGDVLDTLETILATGFANPSLIDAGKVLYKPLPGSVGLPPFAPWALSSPWVTVSDFSAATHEQSPSRAPHSYPRFFAISFELSYLKG